MATTQNNISVKALHDLFVNDGVATQSMINTAFDPLFNSMAWKKYFVKANMPTPVTGDGAALFQMASMTTTPDTMLNPRSSWSDMDELNKDGFKTYSGSIHQYGRKIKWTPQQLAEFERIAKAVGGNETVVTAYMKKTLDLIKGAHATVSNLSFQLLSKGQFESVNSVGFKTQGKADIPTERIVKAGAKVWSDPSSDIIGKMQLEEADLRNDTQYDGALSWKMDRTTFNYVMANTAVKSLMTSYVGYKVGMTTVSGLPPVLGTVEQYNEWVSLLTLPNLSPIEIVEESQTNMSGQTTKTVVHGWDTGNAVLSPAGIQGEIKYAAIEELDWIDAELCQVAVAEGGLFSLANYKIREGKYSILNTEMFVHLAPALAVFDKMTIVDTTTADS